MDAVIPREYALHAKLLAVACIVAGFAAYLAFLGEKAIIFGYFGFYVLAVLLGVSLVVVAARITTWYGELDRSR